MDEAFDHTSGLAAVIITMPYGRGIVKSTEAFLTVSPAPQTTRTQGRLRING